MNTDPRRFFFCALAVVSREINCVTTSYVGPFFPRSKRSLLIVHWRGGGCANFLSVHANNSGPRMGLRVRTTLTRGSAYSRSQPRSAAKVMLLSSVALLGLTVQWRKKSLSCVQSIQEVVERSWSVQQNRVNQVQDVPVCSSLAVWPSLGVRVAEMSSVPIGTLGPRIQTCVVLFLYHRTRVAKMLVLCGKVQKKSARRTEGRPVFLAFNRSWLICRGIKVA